MRGVAGRFGKSGGLAPIALALLLLFRLLVPSGYMIAPGSDGTPGLTLCAGPAWAAAKVSAHEAHDGHVSDPAPPPAPAGAGELPCAFAALAAPPLPPQPPVIPPRIEGEAPAPSLPTDSDARRVAPASSPPPARGPPLLV